jgi:hypothetical protein
MIDQSLGWLSIVVESLRFFLDIFNMRRTRRRRSRVSYSRWRFMGLERERFDLTDDERS